MPEPSRHGETRCSIKTGSESCHEQSNKQGITAGLNCTKNENRRYVYERYSGLWKKRLCWRWGRAPCSLCWAAAFLCYVGAVFRYPLPLFWCMRFLCLCGELHCIRCGMEEIYGELKRINDFKQAEQDGAERKRRIKESGGEKPRREQCSRRGCFMPPAQRLRQRERAGGLIFSPFLCLVKVLDLVYYYIEIVSNSGGAHREGAAAVSRGRKKRT